MPFFCRKPFSLDFTIIYQKVFSLSYKHLVSKLAADKEGKKLGKVIRIENLPGKTIKKLTPHLMILHSKRFKQDIVVPISAEQVLEAKGSYVLLTLSKDDFDKEAERLRAQKDVRQKYTGIVSNDPTRRAGSSRYGVDYTNLSTKSKERKH